MTSRFDQSLQVSPCGDTVSPLSPEGLTEVSDGDGVNTNTSQHMRIFHHEVILEVFVKSTLITVMIKCNILSINTV